MREALKTNISKYGPKTNAAMTVENIQGKGLQLVVIYAGRKHYLPLSSVPMNADTHANYPNHEKIKVEHNGAISGTVVLEGGVVYIGKSSTTRGFLALYDGGSSANPGYLALYSANGTAHFIHVSNAGDLRISTGGAPGDTSGDVVGTQS